MGGSPNDKEFVYDEEEIEETEEADAESSDEHGASQETETSGSRPTADGSSRLAICLVSGGMDSCVTAAIAREENEELAFLHVSYGQRTEARERRAFEELAGFYGVPRRLAVSIEYLARIGGSSLTDRSIPLTGANLSSKEIPSSYVPFRNAHLLAIAASWAEVIEARRIYIGAVAEDSSGYPDCRPEFYAAFQGAVDAGTKPSARVEIRTPVIRLRKAEIIRRGLALGAPLNLTWSCYGREDLACGVCDSCVLRLRAFRQAGVADPIPYA
jgi:7-cyano-7-deazaguanine synthase